MRMLFPRTDIRTVVYQHHLTRVAETPLTRLPNAILPDHPVLDARLEPQMRVNEDILLPNADIDALDIDVGRVGVEGLPVEPALL